MLKFCLATSLEVLHASVRRKSCWIPKSNGGLNAEFILEGTQRRSCVVGPVTPGASSQAILPETLNLIRKNTYIIIHHIFQIVVPFFYITFSSMQAGIGDNPDRVQSKSPSPDIHIFCHMFQGLGLMSR